MFRYELRIFDITNIEHNLDLMASLKVTTLIKIMILIPVKISPRLQPHSVRQGQSYYFFLQGKCAKTTREEKIGSSEMHSVSFRISDQNNTDHNTYSKDLSVTVRMFQSRMRKLVD